MKYNHKKIEKRWQNFWTKKKIFEPDLARAKKPFYNLMMFPYPSAEGLHVGNMYAFTGADIYGRYRRMKGEDVFEPIGLDGFGIHSENYALQVGIHPKILAKRTQKNFYRQLHATGNGYAWSRKLETYDPGYYRWTQWVFVQMFKNGLAYRAKASVNWCPSCLTVLADEQVIDGKCERCLTKVTRKELEQWFFKITQYAERLLRNLEKIDWPESIKIMQKNWIGRSEGYEVGFKIIGLAERLRVFTTRIDTLFGATYLVIAPEHPLLPRLVAASEKDRVASYLAEVMKKSEFERQAAKIKTGVFTGSYAVNPATRERIPIWVSDYVLVTYGTGAIMGVPAHDSRDYEFAQRMHLPIRQVVRNPEGESGLYEGEGELINSGPFDRLQSDVAREKIANFVGARAKVQYKIRDWLISRQRYWGPPIPVVFCENCKKRLENYQAQMPNSKLKKEYSKGELENPGWIAVPERDLPILLPDVKNFRPTGTGVGPLASVPSFVKTNCPKCKGLARRETDVSDTFLDSAWYFLRYPSVKYKKGPWEARVTRKWLPVDMYIGGAEHAVLHLLYSRFLTMVFPDWGLLNFEEPFEKFRTNGLLIKDGAKMSKSRGNVVVPDEYIKKYGADTLRTYLMFLGPFQQGGDFRDEGIVGAWRFLNRVWDLGSKVDKRKAKSKPSPRGILQAKHRTIKKVSEDIEALSYNTAIASLMEYTNVLLSNVENISEDDFATLVKLLNPFAPHLAEELWHLLGNRTSIQKESWPKYNPKYLRELTLTYAIQINGRLRDTIKVKAGISREEVEKQALGRPKVKKWLEGKRPKKVFFVQDKLINFVAK